MTEGLIAILYPTFLNATSRPLEAFHVKEKFMEPVSHD
jgi:hypothetical protein